jgi:gliding-associated putative ABC transporter substrate-binding component GldG
MKIKTAAESLVTTLAAALALLLVNALVCGSRSRVDLTEQKIYSLSDASARLVKNLPERVAIQAYFGNVPSEHKEKQHYVESLLAEYAKASGGKVTFEKIDPWDQPELQQELKQEGIDRILLVTVQDDKAEQVPAYFTVQFTHLDKRERWGPDPRFGFHVEGLEYEFSSRIKRLAWPKRRVGVTKGFGEPDQAGALAHEQIGLAGFHEVVPLDWAENPRAIDDVDVLVVNGPTRRVSEAAQWHLDQHLMRGKPALLLVRGMQFQASGNPHMLPEMQQGAQPYLGSPADHGLAELLAHHGFQVEADTVVDPRNAAPGIVPLGQEVLLAHVFFPLAETLAHGQHEPLEGIRMVAMPFVSTVKLVGPMAGGGFGGEVQPLLRTAPTSFRRAGMLPITRELKIAPTEGSQGPHEVAWMATGTFRSFFAGKPTPEGVTPPPPADPAEAGELMSASPAGGALEQSPPGTRLIVVGGSEFAEDKMFSIMRYVGTDVYLNGFRAVQTMVDWLLQDTDLARVRGKQVARPIRSLEKKDRLLVKYGNVVGAPLAIVLFGVVFWQVRERRRRNVKL